MRSSSSAIGAAAAACSKSSRTRSLLATSRASLTTSSERPFEHSTSTTEYSSRRAENAFAGLRAPLATARICEPSSARSVSTRSVSPSFVLRSTRARAVYVGEATAARQAFSTLGEADAIPFWSFHVMVPDTVFQSP